MIHVRVRLSRVASRVDSSRRADVLRNRALQAVANALFSKTSNRRIIYWNIQGFVKSHGKGAKVAALFPQKLLRLFKCAIYDLKVLERDFFR